MVIIYLKLMKTEAELSYSLDERKYKGGSEGNLHELLPTDLHKLDRDRFDRLKEIAGAIPLNPCQAPSSAFEKHRDMLDSPFK